MKKLIALICLSSFVASCATDLDSSFSKGEKKSVVERRNAINTMHDQALEDLFAQRPQTRDEIRNAVGYAVFSNFGLQVFLLGGGGGRGVAINKENGKRTYMSMATAAIGLGLGIKDFRAVFVFHDKSAFDFFVDKGWDFQAGADAAAKIDDVGGAQIGEGANISRKVSVYQFTENGLALAASLNGTKYWKSSELN